MYKVLIQTENLPKSTNIKLRSHYFRNHAETKMWQLLISSLIRGQLPKKPLLKAKITVVRHSYRFLDFDGLVGSMKPVVDALVYNNVISDDSWNVLGAWEVHQKFRAKKDGPLLEILVREMPAKLN